MTNQEEKKQELLALLSKAAKSKTIRRPRRLKKDLILKLEVSNDNVLEVLPVSEVNLEAAAILLAVERQHANETLALCNDCVGGPHFCPTLISARAAASPATREYVQENLVHLALENGRA